MIKKFYVWRSAKMTHRTAYLSPIVGNYRIEYERLNTPSFNAINGGRIEKTVDNFFQMIEDEPLYELQEAARRTTWDEFMVVVDAFLAKNPHLNEDVPDSGASFSIWLTAVYSVLRYSVYDKSQIPAE